MIDALPPQISSLVSFLVVGAGGGATELLRFYDLHVVVLPAVLLALLTIKLYMLEVHGISEPTELTNTEQVAIFPDVTIYLMELAAMFGAAMLMISVLFPLTLPARFTPALASQSIPQPDWYFLWIYQILKISVFEGSEGLPIALGIVTFVFVLLVLLPFIDRGNTREITHRPIFVTLGLIFIGEIIVLAYWGYTTPGQIIPLGQALLVLGGTAIAIGAISLSAFRLEVGPKHVQSAKKDKTNLNAFGTTAAFAIIVSFGALAIGTFLSSIVRIILNGADFISVTTFVTGLFTLAGTIIASLFLLYISERRTGRLRTRIALFERIVRSRN
jgi:vacuolar-type H+-ATPase subunit I/STV1